MRTGIAEWIAVAAAALVAVEAVALLQARRELAVYREAYRALSAWTLAALAELAPDRPPDQLRNFDE